MIKIKTQTDKHPITGLDQEVEIAQVAYMDFDIQEAKVKFRVHALDKDGNRIQSNSTTYEAWEYFCNSRLLTQEGRTITKEYIKLLNPKDNTMLLSNPPKEKETQEQYEERIEKIYQEELSKGVPEFDFWITPLISILSGALEQGKHLLNLEQ